LTLLPLFSENADRIANAIEIYGQPTPRQWLHGPHLSVAGTRSREASKFGLNGKDRSVEMKDENVSITMPGNDKVISPDVAAVKS
jgi:hypothetical protein